MGTSLKAPLLFQGVCNTAIFNARLKSELAPLLNRDMVVVIDNAAFHKSQETQTIIENAGATLLFLPPYSPDLMPIEKTFGTIKRYRSFHNHLPLDDIINAFC